MTKRTIAIVGAGRAGVYIAKKLAYELRKTEHEILLFNDASDDMTLQSVFPQIAVKTVPIESAQYNLHRLFRKNQNVKIINKRVTDLNFDTNTLITKDQVYYYDDLVLTTGSMGSTMGIPGVYENATVFNSFAGALQVRHDLEAFLTAREHGEDPTLNLTVVGGGPSGVELMGELASFKANQKISDDRMTLTLVNSDTNLLTSLSLPDLSIKVKKFLTDRGVTVLNNHSVISLNQNFLTLIDGSQIPVQKVYWATGLQSHPMVNDWGIAISDSGQVTVNKEFQVLSDFGEPLEDVYASGNIATFERGQNEILPQLALASAYAGKIISQQIVYKLGLTKQNKAVKAQKRPRYFISLGKNSGVSNAYGQNGSIGPFARWAKHVINLAFFAEIRSGYGFWHYLRYGLPSK
ncbi:NAD(P)/FAD-dependent oxidoreductase [Fructobacillus ficulneus]|uniref:FAD-dependent pyridine nucleotide-disulfide oxidoreductase n=1 Tax=Fructobacillus ficulneus TaxID=157463 RepID=A0A0K8MHI9_9LACO|nr:FAD-dependent oxidoreductase [Fructobacillus ficulneus]GAO99937.1 FAD-dependent pyridine nucleotide-disulfide oxidoreductase [Fructobacillus ficulneus]